MYAQHAVRIHPDFGKLAHRFDLQFDVLCAKSGRAASAARFRSDAALTGAIFNSDRPPPVETAIESRSSTMPDMRRVRSVSEAATSQICSPREAAAPGARRGCADHHQFRGLRRSWLTSASVFPDRAGARRRSQARALRRPPPEGATADRPPGRRGPARRPAASDHESSGRSGSRASRHYDPGREQ